MVRSQSQSQSQSQHHLQRVLQRASRGAVGAGALADLVLLLSGMHRLRECGDHHDGAGGDSRDGDGGGGRVQLSRGPRRGVLL